jgi:MarR family transcriptional regulator, lower aerobic nicotinate degradation pathway regulator
MLSTFSHIIFYIGMIDLGFYLCIPLSSWTKRGAFDVSIPTAIEALPDTARKAAVGEDTVSSLAAFLSMPGYLIRRSKQFSTGVFSETCKDFGITPIQFAALNILHLRPAIDQAELGDVAALDPSTAGDVLQRLERRGLVHRHEQGQRRICDLTTDGMALLRQVTPQVTAAQRRLLAALTAREQAQLLRLLSKMNGVSNLHYKCSTKRRRRRLV